MKTSELTGATLDWAVGKIDQQQWTDEDLRWNTLDYCDTGDPDDAPYSPSTDWAQGGPLIEREELTITPLFFMEGGWRANHHNLRYDEAGEYIYGSDGIMDGPTPLIAAMRCFVASKLGDEVEVPKELE